MNGTMYVLTLTDRAGHWMMRSYSHSEIEAMWQYAEISIDRDGVVDVSVARHGTERIMPGCARPASAPSPTYLRSHISGPLFGLAVAS
jgi:hypothetical protein